MEIKLAQSAGFCYGVNRAVEICYKAADNHKKCVTLGPVIHNKHVTDRLRERGIEAVTDISQVKTDNTVIIRSHGACKNDIGSLAAIGAEVIDATCPDVKKIHDIVRKDSQDGRLILIYGQRNHPEIIAISSWCKEYVIFETPSQFKDWVYTGGNASIPVTIVLQTTGLRAECDIFLSIAKKECTNTQIYDTVCNATERRQTEAAEISKNVDTMIVIGDESSSNSLKLKEICKKHCNNVIFVGCADELQPAMFHKTGNLRPVGERRIGVTAGASTPAFIIKEVIEKMSTKEIMDGITAEGEAAAEVAPLQTLSVPEEEPAAIEPVTAEQTGTEESETEDETGTEESKTEDETGGNCMDSFEEMLEKSIKTLHTGDKVSGIVTTITATEISVDLGAKQSGYIPISEFTDDERTDINEIVKIGDTIEAFITRVNDVEGMIMLSKKRLDAIKNWDVISAAKDSREIVQGYVIQENRGGIVVNVKGVHVFVPASQTGLSKDTPMTELLKKTVKLRINEVNQSRRRVIGSIRDAQKDERREKSEKLWNDIEVGKKYDGIVKSMTSYGVFVDIGGIDGMIHISELSWTRIKQPSEVLSVGDEISVYVISFDKETKKISLGYKKGEDNPWTKFTEEFSVDDIIKAKIVKMMPFGAFAEICPGVDGLIHISQIAEHRLGLPSEVLSEGQMVDVKITEIDNERKKVSLSIRALLEPAEKEEQTDNSIDDDTQQVVYDTDSPPPADETDDETSQETDVQPEVETDSESK